MKRTNPFDLIDKINAKPGDVLRLAPRVFILVAGADRFDSSRNDFYYVRCTSKGFIKATPWDADFTNDDFSAANYVNHSNMIGVSGCEAITKVGHVILKTRVTFYNCTRYQWHLTGVSKIDAYMANLDQRYSLFVDASSQFELAQYAKREDRNYHSENGASVAEFSNMHWLRKCRDANLMKIRRGLGGVK